MFNTLIGSLDYLLIGFQNKKGMVREIKQIEKDSKEKIYICKVERDQKVKVKKFKIKNKNKKREKIKI